MFLGPPFDSFGRSRGTDRSKVGGWIEGRGVASPKGEESCCWKLNEVSSFSKKKLYSMAPIWQKRLERRLYTLGKCIILMEVAVESARWT